MRRDLGNNNWAESVYVENTTPIPVSGTVTSTSSAPPPGGATFLAPAQVSTVANVTTLLIAAAATRTHFMVSSLSTNTANITLTVSGGAITDGYILEPGDSVRVDTAAAVYYRTASAAQTLSLFEVRV